MAIFMDYFLVSLRVLGIATGLVLLRGLAWLVNLLLLAPRRDPLRHIAGPGGPFFKSYLVEASDPDESPASYATWKKEHGKTFRFHGFGKHDYRLMTFDFRAITHILSSPVYEKPWQTRAYLSRLIGQGIFSTEGHEHRIQRKLIAPAFSSQFVKTLSPIFLDKAEQLCDVLESHIAEDDDSATINTPYWLSRATFDIIGLTGFDYTFNSLEDESEPMHQAFRRMFQTTDKGFTPRAILEIYFPILNKIWPTQDTKTVDQSLKEIAVVGERIISNKRREILAQGDEHTSKDIMSLLIKSNMSSDPSWRLSDKDLLDQCSTFLLAGSDSSSVVMTWCLHLLATHPEVQNTLAEEIRTAIKESKLHDDSYDSDDSDDSGFAEDPRFKREGAERSRAAVIEALESLPYLNGVVKETLRLYPAVHSMIRTATKDDEIPLSEPIITPSGEKVSSVKIAKGSYVHIPIEGINTSEELWGPDAPEFDPLRWSNLPKSVTSANVPGFGHLLTFGYGPSSCLGSKFTFSEIKIVVATLVSKFEFTPLEDVKIGKYSCIITRPYVEDRWEEGTQLPLKIIRRS